MGGLVPLLPLSQPATNREAAMTRRTNSRLFMTMLLSGDIMCE